LPPKRKKSRPRGVVDTSVLVGGISGFRKPYIRGKNPSADLLHRWGEKNDFVWLITEDILEIGGLTPAAALQAGTINPAKEMRWLNDIGSISKGKFADIVAIPGDPLADISETQHVKFVMKGGEVFRNEGTILRQAQSVP